MNAADAAATQVARLHFDRQLSKVEIAQRLGISRFRVARLLQHARESGLVRIEYRDLPDLDRELARELELRFELDLCVVAAGDAAATDAAATDAAATDAAATDAVPRLAAHVVADLLEPDETVGVAWGATLAALVRHLPARRLGGLTAVPLAGGSARIAPERAPAELARRFGERLGGGHAELYAPAFVGSADLREALIREDEVAAVLEAYGRMTTAVVGIGAWSPGGDGRGSSLVSSGALSEGELAGLRARGAVGEIVLYPFDATGRFIAPELAERAVAIPLERLRAVPRVVAVAAGHAKAGAIRGALATGVVTILVTDEAAAAAVLAGTAPRARAAEPGMDLAR